jgi:hypothetical protein
MVKEIVSLPSSLANLIHHPGEPDGALPGIFVGFF